MEQESECLWGLAIEILLVSMIESLWRLMGVEMMRDR